MSGGDIVKPWSLPSTILQVGALPSSSPFGILALQPKTNWCQNSFVLCRAMYNLWILRAEEDFPHSFPACWSHQIYQIQASEIFVYGSDVDVDTGSLIWGPNNHLLTSCVANLAVFLWSMWAREAMTDSEGQKMIVFCEFFKTQRWGQRGLFLLKTLQYLRFHLWLHSSTPRWQMYSMYSVTAYAYLFTPMLPEFRWIGHITRSGLSGNVRKHSSEKSKCWWARGDHKQF